MKKRYEFIIIGSGFAGIAAAVNLQRNNFRDYLMLERDEELGGTWWRNSYPGAAVDVQSHLYSLSFEPYDWSRLFAKQYELLKYTNHCLDKYDIRPHALTNANVSKLRYREDDAIWEVHLHDGRLFEATHIINASGGLSQPNIPPFKGLSDYKGKTMHTARWDHSYDYKDKRVAVIGTGASAIQVVPAIAPVVDQLFVFQRQAHWIMPRPDRALTNVERSTFNRFPAIRKAFRNALFAQFEARVIAFRNPDKLIPIVQRDAEKHIENSIADPDLREKVTPTYTMGCKRVLLSNDYYPALSRENVHLITSPTGIDYMNKTGIITTDGKQVDVDLIVFATGFHASENNVVYPIEGLDGRKISDEWANGAHAYLGTTVPFFPNLFILAGPNTATGHTSAIGLIESQIEYIIRALKYKKEKNAKSIEVKAGVEKAYNDRIQKQLEGTVWKTGGCESWYQTKDGKITTLYPTFSVVFRRDCKNFKPGNHVLTT